MKDGFVKAAAGTPDVHVADCAANGKAILKQILEMAKKKAKIMVFPELCITGYTCEDLFWQPLLIEKAREELLHLTAETKDVDALIFLGLPIAHQGKLFNCAAVLNRGKILGIVPKTHLPNYGEFYEQRHFASGGGFLEYMDLGGEKVPFGTELLFRCQELPELVAAAEICEDLWVPAPPSIRHGVAGATVIVNLSASDETVGKDSYRRQMVSGQSARLVCGYIYASAGEGESTQDLVFGGHNIIAENGTVLREGVRFENGVIYGDLDVKRLACERSKMTTFPTGDDQGHLGIPFHLEMEKTVLDRTFDPMPFVPSGKADRDRRCDEILSIQAMGLKTRLAHIHGKSAVVGLSGGLDSTLALLVTARAFDMLGLDRAQIQCVTMPCFGTTDRTYRNACTLAEQIGASLKEVNIKEAVTIHFRDIGHDMEVHDVTYENSQARERTQILMDIANQCGALVIGTGDLSELALGWATYNGDHMSMYGVNGSIPKTLVRHLVGYYADTCGDPKLSQVLLDILDTPVSPELLPPKDGVISQKTEDLVGPYELHDFFLYYMLRAGFSPAKVYRVACEAFAGTYDHETILKWLKTFYRRFFAQQFKRSCLPDGPKVGSVAVSPRGDLRMPSDACSTLWLKELETLPSPSI